MVLFLMSQADSSEYGKEREGREKENWYSCKLTFHTFLTHLGFSVFSVVLDIKIWMTIRWQKNELSISLCHLAVSHIICSPDITTAPHLLCYFLPSITCLSSVHLPHRGQWSNCEGKNWKGFCILHLCSCLTSSWHHFSKKENQC